LPYSVFSSIINPQPAGIDRYYPRGLALSLYILPKSTRFVILKAKFFVPFLLSAVVASLGLGKSIARILFIGKLDKPLRIALQNDFSIKPRGQVYSIIIGE